MDSQLTDSFTHPWKVIAIIDIAVYSVYLLATAYPLFHIARVAFKRFTRVIILYSLLLTTKIASGALDIYLLNNSSLLAESKGVNIYIAATVLMSLAPGFLMMITFKIVEYVNSTYRGHRDVPTKITIVSIIKQIGTPGQRLEGIQMLYWYFVLITLILSSAGNGSMSKNFDTAKNLIRAASILYLIEFFILAGLIVYAIAQVMQLSRVSFKRYVSFMLFCSAAAVIFIGLRVVDYVCTAFTIKHSLGYMNSKFSYLLGNWKLYAFLAFLPEVLVSGIWVLILWSLSLHLKHEDETTGKLQFKDEYSSEMEQEV